jgi:hypothetical protein
MTARSVALVGLSATLYVRWIDRGERREPAPNPV